MSESFTAVPRGRVRVSVTCRHSGRNTGHNFEPDIKRHSQQWKLLDSLPPEKFKAVSRSTGKVMMTSFLDCRGPLLVDFLERGATIHAKRCTDTLQKLRPGIKSKCPGMLSNGIILLHDNARSHIANLMRDKIQKFGWETLQHPRTIQVFPHVTSTFLAS